MSAGDIILFVVVAFMLNFGLILFSVPNKISFRWFVFVNIGAAIVVFVKNDFLSNLFFGILIVAMIISLFSGAWTAILGAWTAILKAITSTFRW